MISQVHGSTIRPHASDSLSSVKGSKRYRRCNPIGIHFTPINGLRQLLRQQLKNNVIPASIRLLSSCCVFSFWKVGEYISKPWKVGKDGVITIEEFISETELEVAEGMQFDRGYLSQYMVTDTVKNGGRPENPYTPLTRRFQIFKKLLKVLKSKSFTLIIADDVVMAKLFSNTCLEQDPRWRRSCQGTRIWDRHARIDYCHLDCGTVITDDFGLNWKMQPLKPFWARLKCQSIKTVLRSSSKVLVSRSDR